MYVYVYDRDFVCERGCVREREREREREKEKKIFKNITMNFLFETSRKKLNSSVTLAIFAESSSLS